MTSLALVYSPLRLSLRAVMESIPSWTATLVSLLVSGKRFQPLGLHRNDQTKKSLHTRLKAKFGHRLDLNLSSLPAWIQVSRLASRRNLQDWSSAFPHPYPAGESVPSPKS